MKSSRIKRLWAAQAQRRLKALRSGAVKPIPVEAVFQKWRDKYDDEAGSAEALRRNAEMDRDPSVAMSLAVLRRAINLSK